MTGSVPLAAALAAWLAPQILAVGAAKTEDNLSETASYKSFNYQPAIIHSSYNEAQAWPYPFNTTSVQPLFASSFIHKIRLHLTTAFC